MYFEATKYDVPMVTVFVVNKVLLLCSIMLLCLMFFEKITFNINHNKNKNVV